MKRLKEAVKLVVFTLIVALSYPSQVHAYLDPGSGSLILQTIGMVFITFSGFFFIFKDKIRMLFGKKTSETEEDEETDDEEEDDENAEMDKE